MKSDFGIQLEEMESEDLVNDEVRVKGDCRECRRCLEMENDIMKVNEQYQLLELEIEEKKNVVERLEGKLGFMELKRLKFEDEVSVLRQSNADLEMSIRTGERVTGKENGVVDLTMVDDEEDKITKLIIENSVLQCEKKKAECEIDGWKAKYKELEMQVVELRKSLLAEMSKKGLDFHDVDSAKLNGKTVLNPVPASIVQNYDEYKLVEDDNVTAVTSPGDTPSRKYTRADEMKRSHQREFNAKYGRRVRKCLSFTKDKSPLKSFSPSTPGCRPRVSAIDISDRDDTLDAPDIHLPNIDLTGRKVAFNFNDDGMGNSMYENNLTSKACTGVLEQQGHEEEVACYNRSKPYLLTPKRRRVSKVVTSDTESDDNIPIGRFMSKNQQSHVLNLNLYSDSESETESHNKIDVLKPRRRLMKQLNFAEMGASRKCTYKGNEGSNIVGTPRSESDEEEMKLGDSGSEGESLGGFIVNSSDVSDSHVSAEDTFSESEDSSYSSGMDYKEIMSGLRRDSKHKMKWEFEADMLADFGKNPEICMKAVCALYRQQTSEEKSCKATMNLNGRGFSQCDAYRGSALAEFLTEGEPRSDVKKSVEELLGFNPKGGELCRELAKRYSKQLFAIYHNGEDPFFKSPQPGGRC